MKKNLILVYSTLLNAISSNGIAASFSLSGEVRSFMNIPLQNGQPTNELTKFKVDFVDCNWRIQTEREGRQLTLKSDVGSTNDDIYAVSYYRPNGSTNWRVSNGSLRPGPVPFIIGDAMVQCLWVALISHCKFEGSGVQPQPRVFFPYSPALKNADFKLPTMIERNKTPPFFLTTYVAFVDVWKYWEEERDSWVQPPLQKALPIPYQSGCTVAVYVVTSFAKDGQSEWPETFRFVFYGMKNNARDSKDLRVIGEIEGKVNEYEANASLSPLLPIVPEGALINDERFIWEKSPVFSFLYASHGRWLSKGEAAETVPYKRQIELQKKQIRMDCAWILCKWHLQLQCTDN